MANLVFLRITNGREEYMYAWKDTKDDRYHY